MQVDFTAGKFAWRGIELAELSPLIDGEVPPHEPAEIGDDHITWPLAEGLATLRIERGDTLRLHFELTGLPPERAVDSLGIRFGAVSGVRRYLRNGYQSWDGSYFVEPGTPAGEGPPAKAPTLGFAMTALLPADAGAAILGFTRHDRFHNRFRFGGTADSATMGVETLWDRVPHEGTLTAEPLVLFADDEVEEGLRRWSRTVAAESPQPPRIPPRRITGWCSWYSLYASIDEPLILEHLAAAAAFRDKYQVPLDVFQLDDGFTPEMGDWLDVKPQFPRGMKPLLADIEQAGFLPGLWIAPFMVGNRSRLFREHPDWVVVRSDGGGPLAHMKFYGEFRWHKRSEEYYILDITRPDAEAYIRGVFRTWRRDWGCRYFKTDFMLLGSEYGPAAARWHRSGLSRIAIWRKMASLIREEVGDAVVLGCGCPLWASVGLVDAVRIGRDIGVTWTGDYSAESLLRDLVTRNHASGILWQADPDCVLLRQRFHDLSDEQVRSLLLFAGLSGGVLMTSDKLDELPTDRAELFAALLAAPVQRCDFPELGAPDESIIVQRALTDDGSKIVNVFNNRGAPASITRGRTEGFDMGFELGPYASRVDGQGWALANARSSSG